MGDLSKLGICIPARYQSSRFPGKPLVPIAGTPLILRVLEACQSTGIESWVITDHPEIADLVTKHGGKVLRVDDPVETGSERIACAIERFPEHFAQKKFIFNVQGDEPLLKGGDLLSLADFLPKSNFSAATLVRRRSLEASQADFLSPHTVKVIYRPEQNHCAYFSRAPIPFHQKHPENLSWYQHIGIYLYRKEVLLAMASWPKSRYEQLENLEQLRLLDNQHSIGALETSNVYYGVDTPEDVSVVEKEIYGEAP
jgi:3-deoxy-manno-octulosonate cytidylyltransferase (CMP-KDO synthetase)